jgi:RPC5 protein
MSRLYAKSAEVPVGDELIREIDVYLGSNRDLFLLQFPLKPLYSEAPAADRAKYKTQHKRLELSVPYPEEFFEDGIDLDTKTFQTILSHVVAQKTNLAVG